MLLLTLNLLCATCQGEDERQHQNARVQQTAKRATRAHGARLRARGASRAYRARLCLATPPHMPEHFKTSPNFYAVITVAISLHKTSRSDRADSDVRSGLAPAPPARSRAPHAFSFFASDIVLYTSQNLARIFVRLNIAARGISELLYLLNIVFNPEMYLLYRSANGTLRYF